MNNLRLFGHGSMSLRRILVGMSQGKLKGRELLDGYRPK